MPSVVLPPARSKQVESWLTGRGVKFAAPRLIPLDQIKRAESRRNQARAAALDPEVVDRYTTAVRAGEEFPPAVVYRSGQGFILVDGNHRDEAHVKARADSIAAYELAADTPSSLIELLTVEANTRHGQPTDTAWRVKQAMQLLATGEHDMDTITAALGVTVNQITAARRAAKSDARAHRTGVYGWGDIPFTSRALLASLTSDPVFAASAEAVITTAMTTDDLKGLVRQVKAAVSEADALRIVGEVADQRKSQMTGSRKGRQNRLANPRTRVLAALGQVAALTPTELPRLFHTEWDRREVASRCADAAIVLMEMEEVLRDALRS